MGGRGRAHVGRGVGAQEPHQHLRIARQRCNAEHALRGVRVFVQRGTEKELVKHVEVVF